MKIAALLFAAAATAFAQVPAADLRWLHTTPQVVNVRNFQPLLIEAHVGANITRVDLVQNDTTVPAIPFRDDGLQGDRIANDKIFSLILPAAEVQKNYTGRTVFARDTFMFLGLAEVRTATASLGKFTIAALVLADNVGSVPVTRTPTGQFTSTVYNYSVPMSQFLTEAFSLPTMFNHFLSEFNDVFDFVNLVTIGSLFENRSHTTVFNNIAGIGTPNLSNRNQFGGTTTLLGVNRFPNDYLYGSIAEDGLAYAHETGHQWNQNLRSIPELLPSVPHWPLGTLATGVMGFSIPPTNQGGSFLYNLQPVTGGYLAVAQTGHPRFTDMELYMMGLIPKEQVGPHFVFTNVDITALFGQVQRNQPIPNATIPITVDQIIAAHGLRSPGPATSQKIFRTATVLVTPDTLATQDLMDWIHNETNWQNAHFFLATGGRAQTPMLIEDARKGRTQPAVYLQRVVNAASNAEGPIAPQEIVVLNGSGIGPDLLTGAALTADNKFPATVGGVRVLFDGEPAPMIYALKTQVSAVVPSSVAGKTTVQVVVEVQGVRSNVLTIPVATVRPAIFTATSTGIGAGAIQNQDFTLNTVENPTKRLDASIIYLTGTGLLNPPLTDGSLAATASVIPGTVKVTVQGVDAKVLYAGAVPGSIAGLVQINIEMPATGGTVERQLIVTINGQPTQSHVIIHGTNIR